jgi:hypothetical protein
MRKFLSLIFSLMQAAPAAGQAFTQVPFVFQPNTQANASQVMADFQAIVNAGNAVANYIASEIAAVTPPPSGSIMWFNLSACPSGWTNIGANFSGSDITGQYVRGLDLGAGNDPSGTGLLAFEVQQMQDHQHGLTSQVVNSVSTVTFGTGTTSNQQFYVVANPVGNPATGAVNSGRVGSIVRPKSVYLLICEKN